LFRKFLFLLEKFRKQTRVCRAMDHVGRERQLQPKLTSAHDVTKLASFPLSLNFKVYKVLSAGDVEKKKVGREIAARKWEEFWYTRLK
jgi:hypothetical protein